MNAAIKTVRCCKKCSECGDCYTHSLHSVRDILFAIDLEIADFAKNFAQRLNWGYGPVCISEQSVKRLLTLKDTIKRYYDNLLQGAMVCLCDIEFQKVKEKVLKIVDLKKCLKRPEQAIRYDRSGYASWITKHPSCVAYEKWEKHLVSCIPPTITFSGKKEEEKAIGALHFLVTRDDKQCIHEILAYAYKAKCEHRLSASAKEIEQCRVEFRSLVKEYKCDLTFSGYAKLLNCNLTFNAVAEILNCGGSFTFDKNGTPKVKFGRKVTKLSDLIDLGGGTWIDALNEGIYKELYPSS